MPAQEVACCRASDVRAGYEVKHMGLLTSSDSPSGGPGIVRSEPGNTTSTVSATQGGWVACAVDATLGTALSRRGKSTHRGLASTVTRARATDNVEADDASHKWGYGNLPPYTEIRRPGEDDGVGET